MIAARAAAALVLVAFPAAASAANAPLPLLAEPYRDTRSGGLAIRLSGRVAADPGDRVVIEARTCMARFWRHLADTRTVGGGAWHHTLGGPFGKPGDIESGQSYRVRWKSQYSAPWTFRSRMHPGVRKLRDGAFRVDVHSAGPLQSLARKPVVLQRQAGSRWIDVRRQRLRLVSARQFTTTFTVPTRGLTLRVVVPTGTARPCYNSGASEPFRS